MTSERWQRIKEVFNAAAEREPAERSAFLDEACAADRELRQYVESLLAHDGSRSGLLESQLEAGDWLADERERVLREALRNDEQFGRGTGRRSRDGRLTPGELVGAYRVVEFLGAGGMGEIYKAIDTRLGRAVALKLAPAAPFTCGGSDSPMGPCCR